MTDGPLAAAGFALYALPYFIPRFVARHRDPDTVSTIKLGAALVVYPVWMDGLVTAALALAGTPGCHQHMLTLLP
ncbi:MAG: hypothetical protein NT062_17990 [Proteobacteria bacterium]|nr:hypothetical protein [Pseudomonadota bacterium]